jgi:alpha-tubulin suppressor-like RCC1 family protein
VTLGTLSVTLGEEVAFSVADRRASRRSDEVRIEVFRVRGEVQSLARFTASLSDLATPRSFSFVPDDVGVYGIAVAVASAPQDGVVVRFGARPQSAGPRDLLAFGVHDLAAEVAAICDTSADLISQSLLGHDLLLQPSESLDLAGVRVLRSADASATVANVWCVAGAMSGVLAEDNDLLFFEPLRRFDSTAAPTSYVIYRTADMGYPLPSAADLGGTATAGVDTGRALTTLDGQPCRAFRVALYQDKPLPCSSTQPCDELPLLQYYFDQVKDIFYRQTTVELEPSGPAYLDTTGFSHESLTSLLADFCMNPGSSVETEVADNWCEGEVLTDVPLVGTAPAADTKFLLTFASLPCDMRSTAGMSCSVWKCATAWVYPLDLGACGLYALLSNGGTMLIMAHELGHQLGAGEDCAPLEDEDGCFGLPNCRLDWSGVSCSRLEPGSIMQTAACPAGFGCVRPRFSARSVAEIQTKGRQVLCPSGQAALDAVKLGAGTAHSCALLSAGTVACWGSNEFGQLGNGTFADSSTPVIVPGLLASDLAVGHAHTCAIVEGGAVLCWGQNTAGQLGDGSQTSRGLPTPVAGLPGEVIAVAAGFSHSCAAVSGGTVFCWGEWSASSPTQVPGADSVSVRRLAAGFGHSCLVTGGGGLQCWGTNASGQLGDGTTTSSDSPVDVVGLSSGVTDVATGDHVTCAVAEGGVAKCWGDDYGGALGDGKAGIIGTGGFSYVPSDVVGIGTGVEQIVTSGWHTCALVAGGSAWCWGFNDHGQTGGDTPIRLEPSAVGVGGEVSQVVAGYRHTCAVLSLGGVWCWGENAYGQLGDGTLVDRHTPVAVRGLSP